MASRVAAAGRNGDDRLIHVRSDEIPAIQRALHTKGTVNPFTQAREFYASSDGNHMQGGGGSPGKSNSAGNTGNGGGSHQATGHQAAITQAATGQNMTDAGSGNRTTASAGNGPSADRYWSSTPEPPVGGGTYTSPDYSPGAVENHPDANLAAVADMLSSAVPMGGLINTAYKGAKAAVTGSDALSASAMGPIGDALGGDPGPQRGWAPDRNHGAVNPFGGNGSAQGTILTSPLRALRLVTGGDPLATTPTPAQKIKTYSSATTVL